MNKSNNTNQIREKSESSGRLVQNMEKGEVVKNVKQQKIGGRPMTNIIILLQFSL